MGECGAFHRRGWFHRRKEVSWSGSFEGEFLRHDSHEEWFERVERAIRRSEEDRFFSLEELAREFSTARQRVRMCEETQVETLLSEESDAVFSPMCAVCFQKLEEEKMMSVMEGSKRWSTAENPRNREYSQQEEGWRSQSVYLVRCRKCTCGRKGDSLFQRRQNAMALDGVPSTLIPSMSGIPLCSLCFRVLTYADTLRPQEAEPVHVRMSDNQIQAATFSRYMTRKVRMETTCYV